MAQYDGELKFGTKIDTSGFEEGVDDLEKKGKQATENFDNGLDGNKKSLVSLKNVAKVAGAYIAGSLFKDALTQGVQFNAQVEQYTAKFQTFTGSVEGANEVVNELIDLGASTPFEFLDLANATELMMAYGFSAEEATGYLTMLGDASGGNAEKLNSITTAFARMKSTSKVTLETLNLMTENGFSPLQTMADNLGVSMADLYDMISAGKVTFEDVETAIIQMTSEGGQYFGLMETQAQTLDGKVSTLNDTWNIFLGERMQPINTFLRDTLIPTLIDVLTNFEKYEPVITLTGIAIGTVTALLIAYNVQQTLATKNLTLWGAASGFATTVTTALGTAFTFLTSPIGLVILAIGAVIAIGYLLIANWEEVSAFAYKTWGQIQTAFSNVGTWFTKNVLNPIKNTFSSVWNAIYSTVSSVWNKILVLFSTGGKIFSGVVDGIASVFRTIVNAIIRGINKVIATPFNTVNGILNKIRSISILGLKPFSKLWGYSPLPVPQIPQLEKGGILAKGQVGYLEGNGAEAVVPLDRNKYWVKAVAKEFARIMPQTITNNQGQTINFYSTVATPDEVSRKLRIDSRLGLIR